MEVESAAASSESEYVDTHAGDVRVVKKLNEFVEEVFRELHMGVDNDIMKLKTKGYYGPQTFGGRHCGVAYRLRFLQPTDHP